MRTLVGGADIGGPFSCPIWPFAQFEKDHITPIVSSPLPTAALSLERRAIDIQRMILQSAIDRDKDTAFAALLNDPLVSIPTDKAWKMFNEMLEYTKSMLPGW